MSTKISFKLYGRYALFSDPITRSSGEKFSYPIPTYQALKGICESIYWKPTIIWYIDKIRVLNKIEYESKGIRLTSYKDTTLDLANYSYLRNVAYEVEAHYEWNMVRSELTHDRNYNKHNAIVKRSLLAGGRRDIFLGTRECQGYVEPSDYGTEDSYYDNKKMISFGNMFHSFSYPDENEEHCFLERYGYVEMKNGEVIFEHPTSKKLCTRVIRGKNQKYKQFVDKNNFSKLTDEEHD